MPTTIFEQRDRSVEFYWNVYVKDSTIDALLLSYLAQGDRVRQMSSDAMILQALQGYWLPYAACCPTLAVGVIQDPRTVAKVAIAQLARQIIALQTQFGLSDAELVIDIPSLLPDPGDFPPDASNVYRLYPWRDNP
jgi:hypothetical protein